MKKIKIIALTFLCASTLHGMEKPKYWEMLPNELHKEIIMKSIAASNDINQAIETIKLMCEFQGIQYDKLFENDLKGFTAFISALKEKFPNITRDDLAQKFDTPIAKEYLQLGAELILQLTGWENQGRRPFQHTFNNIVSLVNDGVDVNYTIGYHTEPLSFAILAKSAQTTKVVELLLNNGAILTSQVYCYMDKLNREAETGKLNQTDLQRYNAIKALIEKAELEQPENKQKAEASKKRIDDIFNKSAGK